MKSMHTSSSACAPLRLDQSTTQDFASFDADNKTRHSHSEKRFNHESNEILGESLDDGDFIIDPARGDETSPNYKTSILTKRTTRVKKGTNKLPARKALGEISSNLPVVKKNPGYNTFAKSENPGHFQDENFSYAEYTSQDFDHYHGINAGSLLVDPRLASGSAFIGLPTPKAAGKRKPASSSGDAGYKPSKKLKSLAALALAATGNFEHITPAKKTRNNLQNGHHRHSVDSPKADADGPNAPLRCHWDGCTETFPYEEGANSIKIHLDSVHLERSMFRGEHVPREGGYACKWQNCTFSSTAARRYHLQSHLLTHLGEAALRTLCVCGHQGKRMVDVSKRHIPRCPQTQTLGITDVGGLRNMFGGDWPVNERSPYAKSNFAPVPIGTGENFTGGRRVKKSSSHSEGASADKENYKSGNSTDTGSSHENKSFDMSLIDPALSGSSGPTSPVESETSKVAQPLAEKDKNVHPMTNEYYTYY